MTTTTPNTEPSEIVIGETLRWTRFVQDYKPADGWTVKYYFRARFGPGFDIVTIPDSSNHLVDDFETSTVAGLLAGELTWQAWVTKGSEKHFIAQGATTVRAGLIGSSASTAADIRSDTKKALDVIRAVLAGTASKNQQRYMIGDREVWRYTPTELLALEKRFTRLNNQEVRKAKRAAGSPVMDNVNVRFTTPQ